MNKSQLLKRIKANKDEINRLKTENETLQSTAVLKGYARWVYNKNGELQEKAPPMTWWNQHRRTTYVNLSQKAKEEVNFIRKTKCFCTHECFNQVNILFNPKFYTKLIKISSTIK